MYWFRRHLEPLLRKVGSASTIFQCVPSCEYKTIPLWARRDRYRFSIPILLRSVACIWNLFIYMVEKRILNRLPLGIDQRILIYSIHWMPRIVSVQVGRPPRESMTGDFG